MNFAKVFDGISLAEACDFSFPSGIIAQEKIDGVRAMWVGNEGRFIGRNGPIESDLFINSTCTIDGELKAGKFHAFDLLTLNGQDITNEPIEFRINQLFTVSEDKFRVVVTSSDPQTLARHVNFSGGEGIVIKRSGSAYHRGQWTRCKREMTIDAMILSKDEMKRTAVVQFAGENVSGIFGFTQAEIEIAMPGQLIEVKAMEMTKAGKLRHGRFLRFRSDK